MSGALAGVLTGIGQIGALLAGPPVTLGAIGFDGWEVPHAVDVDGSKPN